MSDLSFATITPTLNRKDADTLEYLKLFVRTFKKYSSYKNRLYIHVDGKGTEMPKWLDSEGIPYTQWEWKGYNLSCNYLFKQAEEDIIFHLNDDLVFSPKWDVNAISWFDEPLVATVCPHRIEPLDVNFGEHPDEFDEEAFVDYVRKNSTRKYIPRIWSIQAIKRDLWMEMGGMDEAYSPYGAGDRDLRMRIMHKHPEIRIIEVYDSILYHFVSAAKRKLQLNPETHWDRYKKGDQALLLKRHGMGSGEMSEVLKEWQIKRDLEYKRTGK